MDSLSCTLIPGRVLAARRGSRSFSVLARVRISLSSDVSASSATQRDVVYLEDYDLVTLERDHFDIVSLAGTDATFQVSKVEFTHEDCGKGRLSALHAEGDPSNQPGAVRDAMRGRYQPKRAQQNSGD